jgi:hypothetical protein
LEKIADYGLATFVGGASKMVNQEVTMLFDRILKWREHRNALTNGRDSKAAESPVSGPLSHEPSLKAAVKYVLKVAGCRVSPSGVRIMLQGAGYPIEKYKGNPLLSICPTLNRLVVDGSVRQVCGDGRKEYEWIGPD